MTTLVNDMTKHYPNDVSLLIAGSNRKVLLENVARQGKIIADYLGDLAIPVNPSKSTAILFVLVHLYGRIFHVEFITNHH
jgi:hypothetical protein